MNDIKQPGRARRATIKTVAADAGVSVAAVSKVLRNAYGVSDDMREKVQASIARLGYRPSVSARGMRGSTYTIGILLIEIGNPFLSMVVEGAQETLEKSKFKALLGLGHGTSSIEISLIESLMDYRMDGLLLIAPQIAGAQLDALGAQIPMVAIAHHQENATALDTVNSDDIAGAALAVNSLIERGYRDIAFVAFSDAMTQESSVCGQRERGYLQAMAEAGLSDAARVIRLEGAGLAPDLSLFDCLLDAPDRPRAVVVWSDLYAVPLLNAARSRGIRVPEDLAIIGYDNSPVAALPLIDLASIDQQPSLIGATAVNCLIERIEGRKEPRKELIPPQLVMRSSL